MFEPMTQEQILRTEDWPPQAILRRPIEDFRRDGLAYHEGEDGLDRYRGVFGTVDGVPMALKVHPGNPDGMVSLYLEPAVEDLDAITARVRGAVRAFGLDESDVWWERRDGLDHPRHAPGAA